MHYLHVECSMKALYDIAYKRYVLHIYVYFQNRRIRMNKEKLKELCQMFYGASGLPIYIFEDEISVYELSPQPELIPIIPFHSLSSSQNPGIYASDSHGLWGIIAFPDQKIYVAMGPAYTVPFTDALFRDYMRENAFEAERYDDVVRFFGMLPKVTISQMLNKEALLYYLLSGETIDPVTHFDIYRESVSEERRRRETKISAENRDNSFTHNTYAWEMELYRIIRTGNSAALAEYFNDMETISQLQEGDVAENPIRKAKNLFIGLITKIGMLAAIPGGLDTEQTYRLIDLYERECESLNDIATIYRMHYVAAMDFCRRIAKTAVPDGVSAEVHQCIEYIRNHINENISVSDIAEYIERSPSFVQTHFQKELNMSTGAYIMKCRLEEAASLLTYSERSLSQISSYLCFASQSHFQNTFRRHFGMTPLQYRRSTQATRD